MNDFQIEFAERDARTVVLRPSGQLDARSAQVLMDRCSAVRESRRNLILNLSAITMIASSGVGALLALVDEYNQGSETIRLAQLSPAVESVVTLLNLDQFLAIDTSEDAAAAALSA